MATSKTEWAILFNDKLLCLRCGEVYTINLPASVRILGSTCKAFVEDHAGCKPHADGDVCVNCMQRGHKPEDCKATSGDPYAWRRGHDTGLSSETIWDIMMHGRAARPSVPLDPSDFGRCYRLFKLFPAWRGQLEKLRAVPGWSKLVAAWPKMERLYEEELPKKTAPKLYALMQTLTRNA